MAKKGQIRGKDRIKVKSVGLDDSLDGRERKSKLVSSFHV